jgi:translation elongation factor EF-Ts
MKISTGENLSIARIHKLEGGGDAVFGSYVHHDGKTAVLLQGQGGIGDEVLRDICMHIRRGSAASPGRHS